MMSLAQHRQSDHEQEGLMVASSNGRIATEAQAKESDCLVLKDMALR